MHINARRATVSECVMERKGGTTHTAMRDNSEEDTRTRPQVDCYWCRDSNTKVGQIVPIK